MKEFTANPFGKGNNKLFPPKFQFTEEGVKLIQQGVFKGKEFFVKYADIKDVTINTPMLGFASILIRGGEFTSKDPISGFTNVEVKRMKELAMLGKENYQELLKELAKIDDDDVDEEEDDEEYDDEEEEENEDDEDSSIFGTFKSAFSSSPKSQSTETSVAASVVTTPSAVPPSAKSTPPPPPPSFSFYALIDNKQYGPYDKIQFKRLVDNDMVNMDTLVWKEGMAQWEAAKDVPDLEEFFPKKNSQTPPPPPTTMGPPPPPVQ